MSRDASSSPSAEKSICLHSSVYCLAYDHLVYIHIYISDMAVELSVPESGVKRPTSSYSSLPELSKPFLIDPSSRSYKHQYANIYFVRLVELRPIVEERAGERWKNVKGVFL